MSAPIRTERLLIRDYVADLDDVAAVLGDPAVFWWEDRPYDRGRTARWLSVEMEYAARDGSGIRAVVLLATGHVIGGVALKARDMPWGVEHEVGYHLASSQWHHGYATEAALAMVDEARARGLRRVVSFIEPSNAASKAVAGRLGMSRERDIVWAGRSHELWARTLP